MPGIHRRPIDPRVRAAALVVLAITVAGGGLWAVDNGAPKRASTRSSPPAAMDAPLPVPEDENPELWPAPAPEPELTYERPILIGPDVVRYEYLPVPVSPKSTPAAPGAPTPVAPPGPLLNEPGPIVAPPPPEASPTPKPRRPRLEKRCKKRPELPICAAPTPAPLVTDLPQEGAP